MKGAAIGLTSFGARARPPPLGDQKKNAKNIETIVFVTVIVDAP